ncbi:helix-turn-helix domain-containing protein [Salipiger sp. 1_MG-2023]|nr:helix-turn-helix domain-containing protein [Salipiger sp. 1_MG-2023]
MPQSNIPFSHDRWEVLALLREISRELKLGERELSVLSAHLSVLAKGPIRSEQVLVSYAGLPVLLERANCMDERRFRRGEARLEALGLVARKLSANGRRFPVRNGAGRVIDAYGLDLRPLFDALPRLLLVRQERRDLEAERKAICTRISARLSAARRQFEAAQTALPDWFCELARDIRNTLRRAVPGLDALARIEENLSQALSNETPVKAAEPASTPDIMAEDAGQTVRHSDSKQKEIYKQPATSIAEIWQTCPTLSEYYPTPPAHERDLLTRIHDVCGFLGLRPATRDRMAVTLGLHGIARCLDDLAGRISSIERPDAYVASMLRRLELRKPAKTNHVRHIHHYDRGHIGLEIGV